MVHQNVFDEPFLFPNWAFFCYFVFRFRNALFYFILSPSNSRIILNIEKQDFMKKLFLYILFSLVSLGVQSQTTIRYTKPLPKINAQGIITMPVGQTQTIENYSDTEGAVFFIIRHSEKDTAGGSNADLNPIGRGRAKALRKMLEKVKITGVYSTNTPRTRNTAAPTAKRKHLPVEIYDPKKQKELLSSLVDKKGKFLVVGHSNTVHKLVNILTDNEMEKEFSESDYSRLYIVSLKKIGEAKVLMIRF